MHLVSLCTTFNMQRWACNEHPCRGVRRWRHGLKSASRLPGNAEHSVTNPHTDAANKVQVMAGHVQHATHPPAPTHHAQVNRAHVGKQALLDPSQHGNGHHLRNFRLGGGRPVKFGLLSRRWEP